MDARDEPRRMDSYCPQCRDVVPHRVLLDDRTACSCMRCGSMQQLMVPLEA